jgi:purine-binding chemotaxis protein CheW
MSEDGLLKTTQFLTFALEDELFGVNIGKVREVLDFTTITKVPQTPDYMRGVINLRGSVVPVMDLRLKFGKALAEQTVNTCVIIVEVAIDGETVVMGALADAVQEVLDLNSDQIEPPPRFGSKFNSEFIQGMGKHGDQFIIILDVDQVFAGAEQALIQEPELLVANC